MDEQNQEKAPSNPYTDSQSTTSSDDQTDAPADTQPIASTGAKTDVPATPPVPSKTPPPPPAGTMEKPHDLIQDIENGAKPPGFAQGKDKSKFGLFIAFLVVIIIAIYAGVTYLYLDNQKLKKGDVDEPVEQVQIEVTPTPSAKDEIGILNGSIVRTYASGEQTVLVDKTTYPESGIIGFVHVSVSEDDTKMCFESLPPALTPALYAADIDGSGVTKVAENGKVCTWANDNSKLAYLNNAKEGETTDIYVYNISTRAIENISNGAAPEGYLLEEIVGWSIDNDKVFCNYTVTSQEMATASADTEVKCEFELSPEPEVSEI